VERVVVCDRLGTDEKWRNLVPLAFEDYLEADDLLPRLASGALGEFDCVLHMGACSATTERDATYLARNNFEFTKALAEWCVPRGVRFVYASSAATYGDGARGMDDRAQDAASLQRLRPLNAYGYSKQLFDLWAARRGVLGRVVGCKFFNVFGPQRGAQGRHALAGAQGLGPGPGDGGVRLFRSHRPDYQDGEQTRDFLYVKDCVAMTLHLAPAPSAPGLYNLGQRPGEHAGTRSPPRSSPRWAASRASSTSTCRVDPRQVPVPHPGRRRAAARLGLRRAGDAARRRGRRLRRPLPDGDRRLGDEG
jgi:ADP-L-glycero-D-manno-heptose 6-epimerase